MRPWARKLIGAGYFLLCFAPIPLLAGHLLLDDFWPALTLLVLLLPIAYLLSLLPGHLGGSRRPVGVPAARASRGADPDPDRGLRSDAVPEQMRRFSFPLRALACLFAALALALLVGFARIPMMAAATWPRRLGLGGVGAAMLFVALRYIVARESDGPRSAVAGAVLYALTGAASYFMRDEALIRALLYLGIAFMAVSALSLNDQALAAGIAARANAKPPASMRARNRRLLLLLALPVAVIACFDAIRHATVSAARLIALGVLRAITWLANLLGGSESGAMGGGEGGGGDMLAGLPKGEAGAFWLWAEKVLYVAAALLALICLYFVLRKLARLLRALLGRISGYFRRFARSMGEEYADERESLLDWGEVRKGLSENLRKRAQRLFAREKKWADMDARERVRSLVRALYRRADADRLRALTIHEAAPTLRGLSDPHALAVLYDRARYAAQSPDEAEAEAMRDALRKEARR